MIYEEEEMKIEFLSVSMMLDIIDELRARGIKFVCKVDDLGTGHIWLEHGKVSKIAA